MEKFKQYLVFYGNTYYPEGGFEDLKASFNTLEEAEAYLKNLRSFESKWADTWGYIADKDTGLELFNIDDDKEQDDRN